MQSKFNVDETVFFIPQTSDSSVRVHSLKIEAIHIRKDMILYEGGPFTNIREDRLFRVDTESAKAYNLFLEKASS